MESVRTDSPPKELPSSSPPDAGVTLSRGKLLKRSEAARLLGVSTATVRRMEGSTLTPVLGQDGIHRSRRARAESCLTRRATRT